MPRLLALVLVSIPLASVIAGCTLPGEGDLVVRAGEIIVKEGGIELYKRVTVERGGQLILRSFDLRSSVALVVAGRLEAVDSHFRVSEGERSAVFVIAQGGEVDARSSRLIGPSLVHVDGGNLSWSGGGMSMGSIDIKAGAIASFFETDVATKTVETDAEHGFTVAANGFYMRNTSIRGATIDIAEGGRARLINVGISPRQFIGPGDGEVGWTVTVKVRTATAPAANVSVEVRSVPAGDLLESAGITGPDGIVLLEAIEYFARQAGASIEPRNPHRIVAPGRAGAGATIAVQGYSEAMLVVGP